jgi:hypothetical protein
MQCSEDGWLYAWFKQDLASAHTADDYLTALEGVFSDKIISRGSWSAHLPDLTPCSFYLWGNFKDKVLNEPPYLKRNSESPSESTSLGEFQPI